MPFTFVWFFQPNFSILFEEGIKCNCITSHVCKPYKFPPKFSLLKNNYYTFMKNLSINLYVSTLNLMIKLVGYVINRVARLVG
jgi:hypothetical protein